MNSTAMPTFPNLEEVVLKNAPLETVLAQVRFETILSIQDQSRMAAFQEVIRKMYPVFHQDYIQAHTITVAEGAGTVAVNKFPLGRFSDVSGKWRASLSPEFLSLETWDYDSRTDMATRFGFLLETLERCFSPSVVSRVGIRYVNRMRGDALKRLSELISAPLLGAFGSDMAGALLATMSENLFQMEETQLLARWGYLPANTTIDPDVVKPSAEASWILDIDCSKLATVAWNREQLTKEIDTLATNSYRFFRWAVQKEFLEYYGVNA